MRKAITIALVALPLSFLAGCGGGGFSGPPTPVITVSLSPPTASIFVGQTTKFAATVTGSNNTAVTWSVNDVAGGNATVGTIGASGLYTAPAIPPIPNVVTVKAVSAADSSRSATGSVTINHHQSSTHARLHFTRCGGRQQPRHDSDVDWGKLRTAIPGAT